MSDLFINARKPNKRLREAGQILQNDTVEIAVNKGFLRKLRSPDLMQITPPLKPKTTSPALRMATAFFVLFMIFVAVMGSAGWGIFLVLPFVFLIFWGTCWYATIVNPATERILKDLRK